MSIFILIPLLIVIALLVSFLGSVSGVGGGVLFVPLLLWILTDQSFNEIKFVSTLLVFTSAFINVGLEIYQKRFNWILILMILLISLPSIFLGNYLSSLIDQKIAQIIVVVILVIVTLLLSFSDRINQWKQKRKVTQNQQAEKKLWYWLKTNYGLQINLFKLVIITFLGGIITTLTGMGGGPILMPLLILLCGLTMKQAAPISHTIIAVTSLITLCFSYQMFGQQTLNLEISLPMVVGVIGGTGLAFFLKKKIKSEMIIKWILIILIWVSIIKMIIDLTQAF